jgi:hypothetical protein
MGVALSHLGLLSSICRPRRLRGDATPTSDREVPLSQGRTVLYATRPKTPAQLIRATRQHSPKNIAFPAMPADLLDRAKKTTPNP